MRIVKSAEPVSVPALRRSTQYVVAVVAVESWAIRPGEAFTDVATAGLVTFESLMERIIGETGHSAIRERRLD